jgi:hypothetical protein
MGNAQENKRTERRERLESAAGTASQKPRQKEKIAAQKGDTQPEIEKRDS